MPRIRAADRDALLPMSAWLPTGEGVLRELLAWCAFPHVRRRYDAIAPGQHRRIELLAAREERTFAHWDTPHPPEGQLRHRRWWRHLLR
jgi:hypothetical protein